MHRALALLLCLPLASSVLGGCPEADDDEFPRSGTDSGGVEGQIRTPNGLRGLRGVFLQVFADEDEDGVADSDSVVATTMTDDDGQFVFDDLLAGSYVANATRGHFAHTFGFSFTPGNRATLEPEDLPPDGVNITQIAGSCDDAVSLYEQMGFEVTKVATSDAGWLEMLTNPSDIEEVDILLLPCGLPEDWIPQGPTLNTVLGEWLRAGSSLYVSGTAWPVLEAVNEEILDLLGDDEDLDAPETGAGGTIGADVVDVGIAGLFTDATASVRLADNWPVVEQIGENTRAILSATVQTLEFETVEDSPLLIVSEADDRGSIVYSVFGVSGESTDDMHTALAEVLLSL
jgi:hypothetical protein